MARARKGGRPSRPPAQSPQTQGPAHALQGEQHIAHVQARIAIQQHESWSGPLPHPNTLAEFERVAPGSSQLIVKEFTEEAAHRRALEKSQNSFVIRETHLGQASAFLFSIAALGVAGYAAYVGAEWIGGIIGGGVIVSGIVALRKRSQK